VVIASRWRFTHGDIRVPAGMQRQWLEGFRIDYSLACDVNEEVVV
jgi:hypothetical protein